MPQRPSSILDDIDAALGQTAAPTSSSLLDDIDTALRAPLTPGTLDVTKQPKVKNPDGSVSTVRSISIEEDGRSVLIPTVSPDGRILTNQQAIDLYRNSGRHLGIYSDEATATRAAQALHESEAQRVAEPPAPTGVLDWFKNLIGYQPPKPSTPVTPASPTALAPPGTTIDPKTGRRIPLSSVPADLPSVVTGPIEGAIKAVKGVPAIVAPNRPTARTAAANPFGAGPFPTQAGEPTLGSRARGAIDVLEGGMEAGTPFILEGLGTAPVATIKALIVGIGAQQAVDKVGELTGANSTFTRLAGDLTGLVAGGVAVRHPTPEVPRAAQSGGEAGRVPVAGTDVAPVRDTLGTTVAPEPAPVPPDIAGTVGRGTPEQPAPILTAIDEALGQAVHVPPEPPPGSEQVYSPEKPPIVAAIDEALLPPAPEAPTLPEGGRQPEPLAGGDRPAVPGTGPELPHRGPEPGPLDQGGPEPRGGDDTRALPSGPASVPTAYHEHFRELAESARADGFAGTDEELATHYTKALEHAKGIARDIQGSPDEQDTGLELLRFIAKQGGLGVTAEDASGFRGELARMMESLKVKGGQTIRRGPRAGQKMPTRGGGALGDIKDIIVKKGGYPVDRIREAAAEDPRWQHKFDNASDFLAAVDDAIRTANGSSSPKGSSVHDVTKIMGSSIMNVRPGERWWEAPNEQAHQLVDAMETHPFKSVSEAEGQKLLNAADRSQATLADIPLDKLVATQTHFSKDIAHEYVDNPPQPFNRELTHQDVHGTEDVLPLVLEHEGQYYLTGGTHRAAAALARGEDTIQAIVAPVKPEWLTNPPEHRTFLERISPKPPEAPVVDILSTGEQQPRLPGDVGAVRDIEASQQPIAEVSPLQNPPKVGQMVTLRDGAADIGKAGKRGRVWSVQPDDFASRHAYVKWEGESGPPRSISLAEFDRLFERGAEPAAPKVNDPVVALQAMATKGVAEGDRGVVTKMTPYGIPPRAWVKFGDRAPVVVAFQDFFRLFAREERPTADVLSTGELQSRLPGDVGAVRDEEIAHPEFTRNAADPNDFSLSAPPETEASQGRSMFDDLPVTRNPDKLNASSTGGSSGGTVRNDRTTLNAQLVPGGKEFVEHDVVPAVKEAAAQVSAAKNDIRGLFAPAGTSADARTFARLTRAHLAARDQRLERARRVTKQLARSFDRQIGATDGSKEAKAKVLLDFVDAVETPPKEGDVVRALSAQNPKFKYRGLPAEQQDAAILFRELLDGRRREVTSSSGRLQRYIKDYFPHEWARAGKTENLIAKMIGKRPLQGSKAFLKQRSIPTTREGIEAGLEPVSYNPVELVLHKLAEMDKFITATRILKDGRRYGVTKFVPVGVEGPQGWRRFDHSFATVYGPPHVTVPEYLDPSIYDGLNAFLDDLGVAVSRRPRLGGKMLGWARGDREVATKFATNEGVLMHELGHILDERYGLKDQLVKAKATKQELRDLADLRDEGNLADRKDSRKAYVRKGEEKIANLIHAYLYMPDRARKVAPNAIAAIKELIRAHPELKPLNTIQQGRSLRAEMTGTANIPVGGAVIKGYYYGPPDAVRLIDNHLAPGLRGSAAFGLYRRAGNFLNQVQLGLSAFHLTMTGLESVISKQSLAFELLSRGKVGDALRTQLEVPVAPLVDLTRGHQALKQFYDRDAYAPVFNSVIDSVVQGGGGFGWSLFEHEGAPAKFMQALRQGNYPGAALRVIPALVELQAKPIMEGWVPRLKMAAFLDVMRMELPTLGDQADLMEVRRLAADAWDSIDNRFGQLRYDNLFWHATLKDLGMASVRALGWNIGSIREAAGMPIAQMRKAGVLEGGGMEGTGGKGSRPSRLVNVGVDPESGEPIYDESPEPWLHHKTAWLVSTVFVYGLAGAIYQKLHTGQNPQELKDYFFPHNGDGEMRVSIPGYPKDWYSAFHALPGSIVETGKHKLNPLISLLADVWTNEDYFGRAVRNPEDPYLAQLEDVFKFTAKQFQPISTQSFRERKTEEALTGQSTGVNAVESFFGVNKASGAVTRTAAEEMLRTFHPPMPKTQQEGEQSDLKRQIRLGLQAGTPQGRASAAAAAGTGQLSSRQVAYAVRASRSTALVNGSKSLPLAQFVRLYEVATPAERTTLRGLLVSKAGRLTEVPPAQQAALRDRLRAAIALPTSTPISR